MCGAYRTCLSNTCTTAVTSCSMSPLSFSCSTPSMCTSHHKEQVSRSTQCKSCQSTTVCRCSHCRGQACEDCTFLCDLCGEYKGCRRCVKIHRVDCEEARLSPAGECLVPYARAAHGESGKATTSSLCPFGSGKQDSMCERSPTCLSNACTTTVTSCSMSSELQQHPSGFAKVVCYANNAGNKLASGIRASGGVCGRFLPFCSPSLCINYVFFVLMVSATYLAYNLTLTTNRAISHAADNFVESTATGVAQGLGQRLLAWSLRMWMSVSEPDTIFPGSEIVPGVSLVW